MNINVSSVIFEASTTDALSIVFDNDRGERTPMMGSDGQFGRLGGVQKGEGVAESRMDTGVTGPL